MPKCRVIRHPVTQPTDQSYRYIPLTQGQTAIVDATDYNLVSQCNWYAHWNPHTKSFYARSWSFGRIFMHKLILGYGRKEQADHINHDTLDNRRSNLRICTAVQNSQFRTRRSDNISGFKGVYWAHGKWEAAITVNKRTIRLGRFNSPRKAAKAYDKAAKEHFGAFAEPNGG